MTLADAGRAVIIPGPDQNYDRRVDPTGEQKNAGIPQAIFLSDVMPTADGYQSVGYLSTGSLPGRNGGGVGFPLPHSQFVFFFNSGTAQKNLHVLLREAPAGYLDGISGNLQAVPAVWSYTTGSNPATPSGGNVPGLSVAYVRGTNYLFDGVKLYEVTNTAGIVVDFADVSGTVTGLVLADVIAICSCANYLIALLEDGTVAWSSTTTPTDFTASLVSGAGSTIPSDLQGPVMFMTEAPNAFYIYTTKGVIYSQYTGNVRYPFKFHAIADAGSYTFPTQISSDRSRSVQYGFDNSNKIFQIAPDGARLISAEVSTFLERQKKIDLFDSSTNIFTLGTLSTALAITSKRQIYFYLDRYILLPIGTYTYVYDILLQRYGRLKISGMILQRADDVATELHFVSGDAGNLGSKLTFDIYNTSYTFSGVLALGRFQYVRSRKIKLEEIEFEGPPNTSESPVPYATCVILPCQDGRNFDTPVTPMLTADSTGGLLHYLCHQTAQNHTVVIKGAFSVNTLQLSFVPAGAK